MGAQPEDLEREIAATRDNLGKTLDELEVRLSPKHILEVNRPKINVALAAIAALMAIIVGGKVIKARRRR